METVLRIALKFQLSRSFPERRSERKFGGKEEQDEKKKRKAQNILSNNRISASSRQTQIVKSLII